MWPTKPRFSNNFEKFSNIYIFINFKNNHHVDDLKAYKSILNWGLLINQKFEHTFHWTVPSSPRNGLKKNHRHIREINQREGEPSRDPPAITRYEFRHSCCALSCERFARRRPPCARSREQVRAREEFWSARERGPKFSTAPTESSLENRIPTWKNSRRGGEGKSHDFCAPLGRDGGFLRAATEHLSESDRFCGAWSYLIG